MVNLWIITIFVSLNDLQDVVGKWENGGIVFPDAWSPLRLKHGDLKHEKWREGRHQGPIFTVFCDVFVIIYAIPI
jgi:hypothetical protein